VLALPLVPLVSLVPVLLLPALERGCGVVLSSLSLPLPRRREDLSCPLLSLLDESLLERFAFISAEDRPVGDSVSLPFAFELELRLNVELALLTT